MPLSRRELLSSAGIAVASSFAGCVSFLGADRPIQITVINNSTEPHSVDIAVLRGGDVLVEQTVEIAAQSPGHAPLIETTVHTGWVPGGLQLRVQVVLDDTVRQTVPFAINCDSRFTGDDMVIRLQNNRELFIQDMCFTAPRDSSDDDADPGPRVPSVE